MFHCIRGLFFTKRRWPFFSFFVERVGLTREGFIISFLRAPGPLQVDVIMGKQSGASLPVACVTPFAQHRVTRLPPYIFFPQKTILQLYIMYCYYIFSYYMRTKKGFFRGKMRWHGQLGLPGTQWFNPIRWLLVLSLLFCFRNIWILCRGFEKFAHFSHGLAENRTGNSTPGLRWLISRVF